MLHMFKNQSEAHIPEVLTVKPEQPATAQGKTEKAAKFNQVEKFLTNPMVYAAVGLVASSVASATATGKFNGDKLNTALDPLTEAICGTGGSVIKGIGIAIAIGMALLGVIYFLTGNRNGTKTIITGVAGGMLLANIKSLLGAFGLVACDDKGL